MSATAAGLLAAWTLARPAWAWALLLLVPLTILHLYRRRRLVVPFLPLLVEAVGPRRSGGGWHRLREVLSLVLRSLALTALVLALAGLGPADHQEPPTSLIVVVDADVTTRAVESDGRSRYRHGLALARAAVLADAWAEVAVLEARGHPEVLVQATAQRAEAAERLGDLIAEVDAGRRAPARAGADLEGTLALARTLAAGRPRGRILALTARPLPPPRGDGPAVEAWGIGRTSDDQGLVAFDVVPSPEGAAVRVHASVRNDADVPRPRDLVVLFGEEEVARRPLAPPAGETADVVVDLDVPREGTWLRVRLEGEDAFAGNDRASAWLAPSTRPSVLVVREQGARVRPYTQAILEAMGEAIDVEASGSVGVEDLARAGARDVYLVDGVALPEGGLRPGAWLFLAPLAGALPFEVGSPLVHPLVWRSAPDHALVRDLDLGTAYVVRGHPMRGAGVRSLAEADGQTVLAEGERAGVRYVALGLDPEGSDLPLRAALPLLVRNAIRRLAAQPTRPLAPFYRAGESLRPRLALPYGPDAMLRLDGHEEPVRLAPDGTAWEVPSGRAGEVVIVTRGPGDEEWRGRTAFVDIDPQRSIRPVRAAEPEPPARRAEAPEDARWRRALLVFAALCLLADLAVMAGRGRPSAKLAERWANG